jgi:phospholipase C
MLGAPAVAAALPLNLSKALAIPANNRTGSITDVEHVVFLMQENRSFDHYFGTLRGVRGFADPHPATLPSGRSVWHQPARHR